MSKSRQNSNVVNRLTVADDTALALLTGTRNGELVMVRSTGYFYTWNNIGSNWVKTSTVLPVINRAALRIVVGSLGDIVRQADIDLLYIWTDTQGIDDNGITINVGTGSWIASYTGAIDIRWFEAIDDDTVDHTAIFNDACSIGDPVYIPFKTFKLSATTGHVDANGVPVIGNNTELVDTGHIENAAYIQGIIVKGVRNEDLVSHPTVVYAKSKVAVFKNTDNLFRVFSAKKTAGYTMLYMINKETTPTNSLAVTTTDITSFRPGKIYDCVDVIVGNQNITTTSGTISAVSLSDIGMPSDEGVEYQGNRIAGIGWIEYTVDIPRDTNMHILMRKTSASSADVKVSIDGVDIVTGIDLSGAPVNQVFKVEFKAPYSKTGAVVKVENLTAQNADIYGVNTDSLKYLRDMWEYDSHGYYRHSDYDAYVSSGSANDYAIVDADSAIYGGSYHGGEINIVDLLVVDNVEISVPTIALDSVLVGDSVEFKSTLKIDWSGEPTSSAYLDVKRRTIFGGGGFATFNTFDGDITSSTFYDTLFGMNQAFTKVTAPKLYDTTLIADDSRTTIGNENVFEAENPITKQKIRLVHSSVLNKEANLFNFFYKNSGTYLKYYAGSVRTGKKHITSKHCVNVIEFS